MKILVMLFTAILLGAVASGQSLLILGGRDHSVFLGCLNCDKFEDKSIWNKYGDYGFKYSDKSIWNKHGDYGGKYSNFSPFNKNADAPPMIVDKEGNFYGFFTADNYFSKRTNSKLALSIIDFWEAIGEDVSTYYDKLCRH